MSKRNRDGKGDSLLPSHRINFKKLNSKKLNISKIIKNVGANVSLLNRGHQVNTKGGILFQRIDRISNIKTNTNRYNFIFMLDFLIIKNYYLLNCLYQ